MGKHSSAPNFEITNTSNSEHKGYRRAHLNMGGRKQLLCLSSKMMTPPSLPQKHFDLLCIEGLPDQLFKNKDTIGAGGDLVFWCSVKLNTEALEMSHSSSTVNSGCVSQRITSFCSPTPDIIKILGKFGMTGMYSSLVVFSILFFYTPVACAEGKENKKGVMPSIETPCRPVQ